MASKSNVTSGAADGNGVLVQSGSQYRGAGSIGGNATITDSSKGMDFSNAKTGNITFGDSNTDEIFAKTVKELTESNTASLASLLAGTSSRPMPSPGPDLETGGGGGLASFLATIRRNPLPWIGGLVAVLALGLWLKFKRK